MPSNRRAGSAAAEPRSDRVVLDRDEARRMTRELIERDRKILQRLPRQ